MVHVGMGNNVVGQMLGSSGSTEQVDALRKETGLNETSAKATLRSFKKHHPTGVVTRDEFGAVLSAGGIKSRVLADVFWRALSPNKDQQLTLTEFAHAVALVQRADAKRRLQLAFDLCDMDGDGYVARAEMLAVVTDVCALVGVLVSNSGRIFGSAAEFVDAFFAEVDTDRTGRVSRSQFDEHAYKSLDVLAALGLYGNSFASVDNAPSASSSSVVVM